MNKSKFDKNVDEAKSEVVKNAVNVSGIKTLKEKTEEIKKYNEDLGMDDPSTRAKIQAMEDAVKLDKESDVVDEYNPSGELPDLIERRNHRDGIKSKEQILEISEQKKKNEELSAKMNVEKAKDVKESESGKPANIKK